MIVLRFVGTLVLFFFSPVLLLASGLILAATDACFTIFGRKRPVPEQTAGNSCATVVIPNWNGRDLLEKYLPSVVAAMAGHPGSEIIVVDNASVDGSAEFLVRNFPGVRVIRSEENLGFGGGSNLGFHQAKNDIVVARGAE